MTKKNHTRGLSLLELLFSLAIMSCCALLAYPSFHHWQCHQRRIMAHTQLRQLAHTLLHYHILNGTFEGAKPLLALEHKHYQLTVVQLSTRAFQLRATPVGAQRQDGCGALSISQVGRIRTQRSCED